MPGKSTTDAVFALRILAEKYREKQRELHCVFIDLEKAYDRVPREEVWLCLREKGVSETLVRVVQDMYRGSMTAVRSAVGVSEEFEVKVGLHQGSGLSSFLFDIVVDNITAGVRKGVPRSMFFADDIVLVNEDRGELEREIEDWRQAMEVRGLCISRSKTEGMTLNKQGNQPELMLQRVRVPEVREFKYLGSTFQDNGECERKVTRRIQAGWAGWKKVSGVLCDKNISLKVKGKVHKIVSGTTGNKSTSGKTWGGRDEDVTDGDGDYEDGQG